MDHLLLVANPSASGFTGALLREVEDILATAYSVEIVWPQGAADARESAAKAAGSGAAIVAGMGGDGVVHHVAYGLAGTTTAHGIIPTGTTNVLARILGLPTDPRKAARYLAGEPVIGPVPVAHLEASGPAWSSSEYATFAVGVGYDAEVVQLAEQRPYRKARLGGLHFAGSAAWLFASGFRNRPANLRVEANGHSADGNAVMVQIHWPYTYFGKLPLKVTPTPTAGLEVLVLERLGLGRTPMMVWRAALGRPLDRVPGVEVWDAIQEVTVIAEPAGWMQADGELLGRVAEVHITAVREELLVAAPHPGGPPPA